MASARPITRSFQLASILIAKLDLRDESGLTAGAERKQTARLPVPIPAVKQRMRMRHGEGATPGHRHLPHRCDLAPVQMYERERRVVVEPDVLFGSDVQRVAITDRIEAPARLKLEEF